MIYVKNSDPRRHIEVDFSENIGENVVACIDLQTLNNTAIEFSVLRRDWSPAGKRKVGYSVGNSQHPATK